MNGVTVSPLTLGVTGSWDSLKQGGGGRGVSVGYSDGGQSILGLSDPNHPL